MSVRCEGGAIRQVGALSPLPGEDVLDAGGAVLSRVRTLSLAGCLVAVAGPDAPFTLLTEQI